MPADEKQSDMVAIRKSWSIYRLNYPIISWLRRQEGRLLWRGSNLLFTHKAPGSTNLKFKASVWILSPRPMHIMSSRKNWQERFDSMHVSYDKWIKHLFSVMQVQQYWRTSCVTFQKSNYLHKKPKEISVPAWCFDRVEDPGSYAGVKHRNIEDFYAYYC